MLRGVAHGRSPSIEGNAFKRRKIRLSHHPDGLEMSSLRERLAAATTRDEEGYFDDMNCQGTPGTPGSVRSAFSMHMPTTPSAAEVAFTALQYLPMPTIVLSSAKTVVLANEAMGRLLGIGARERGDEGQLGMTPSVTDVIFGQSLSTLGIDMLQGGSPVWVKWDVSDTVFDFSSYGIDLTRNTGILRVHQRKNNSGSKVIYGNDRRYHPYCSRTRPS